MQLSDRGVQLVSEGEVEPRDTREMAIRRLEDGSKIPVVSWDLLLPWSQIELMHDGVTNQFLLV